MIDKTIFESLCEVIADRYAIRAVIDYNNEETMLVDFSDCSDDFKEHDIVCVCTRYKAIYENGEYCGTEDISNKVFRTYTDVFEMVSKEVNENNGNFHIESF